MSFRFGQEMVRDLRDNPLREGELRVFEDYIVFADTMLITEQHKEHRHISLCRPERFPWIVVWLGPITIRGCSYFPMPLGTRIHAQVIWPPGRPASATHIEGPAAYRYPRQLWLPLRPPHKR